MLSTEAAVIREQKQPFPFPMTITYPHITMIKKKSLKLKVVKHNIQMTWWRKLTKTNNFDVGIVT